MQRVHAYYLYDRLASANTASVSTRHEQAAALQQLSSARGSRGGPVQLLPPMPHLCLIIRLCLALLDQVVVCSQVPALHVAGSLGILKCSRLGMPGELRAITGSVSTRLWGRLDVEVYGLA